MMRFCRFVLVVFVVGCEDKHPGPADAAVEAAAATPTVSTPPAPPKPPVITVDDTSFVVTGDKVDLTAPDAKGRIVGMLANKPMVAGETVEVDALRDVTMPHFEAALDALHDAKAKGATVKTAQRDRTMASVDVVFEHGAVAPCSAVGMVAKDNAIMVWSYGGGAAAQRFSHGFAGPDITLGSGALRGAGNACDSPVYFVSGDDSIKWGVVFDLAVAAKTGGSFKPQSLVVLAKAPVPGHAVKE
jgi:hypothetical protein